MTPEEVIQALADELKRLIGWGATPERLPYMPVLRGLVKIDEESPLPAIGYSMLKFLKSRVADFPEVEFRGESKSAALMTRVYRWLLFEHTRNSAEARRARVIMLLGLHCSVSHFRREGSFERDLCVLLASHLINQPDTQAAALPPAA